MKELVGILIGIMITTGGMEVIKIYKEQIGNIKTGIETGELQINEKKNFETEEQILQYINQISEQEKLKIKQICSEIGND